MTENSYLFATILASGFRLNPLLRNLDVEVVVCPVIPTPSRFEVMDFTEAITFTDYSIVYPRPTIQTNIAGFIMPYTLKMWSYILGISVIITVVTYFIRKFTAKRDLKSAICHPARQINVSLLWAFQGLLNQSILVLPKPTSGRILVSIWLLISLIISVTYKCNLKAQLIVPHVEVPFNNLEQLVSQDEYKWSFLKGSIIPLYFEPAFNDNPNSILGQGWAKKGELYTNGKFILSFIVEKKMACITISEKVKQLLSDDFSEYGKCRLAVAKETLIPINQGFALRKGSRMQDPMNYYILRLRESGITQKILYEDLTNLTVCSVPPGKELGLKLRALVVQDFLGIFLILATGFSSAVFAFLGELAFGNMNKERK